MKHALIVGGTKGIGLAVAHELADMSDIEKIYIMGRSRITPEYDHRKFVFLQFDLLKDDYSVFESFNDIDILFISAGFGQLSLFEDIDDTYISSSFRVNAEAPIRIIKYFYCRICSNNDFYCGVMGSIAGFLSSPFFSVYAATKAAIKIYIESVNIELEKRGHKNRILNISPGSIKGTSFDKGQTDLSQTKQLAQEILDNLLAKNDLYIPQYEEIFKEVLDRYHEDFRAEGRHSYDYKIMTKRITPHRTSN